MNRLTTLILAAAIALPAAAATPFFPLRDVRPGMRGVGRTVFEGNKIEEFQVEILGILKNIGPRQSIILARLSGGPLAQTGVLQGMSGSPVYIDGKLLGAVALGFAFSKEPIAGIQPIEQMMQPAAADGAARSAAGTMSYNQWAEKMSSGLNPFPDPAGAGAPASDLRAISTPLGLAGFSEATLGTFAAGLRRLGFDPQQGLGGGTPQGTRYHGTVQPGSMISVQLMTGDLAIGADGTVTYVDGNKVYAFGHRFLATGSTDLPFARADVLALLPNLNSSIKISTARELVGSITRDSSTAVSGEIGRPAHLVPLDVEVRDPRGVRSYHVRVANDRLLTPYLTQMALFSILDSTQRTTGAGTLRVEGRVEFAGNLPALEIRNTFAADSNAPLQAAMTVAIPLSFAMQSGFPELRPKQISFRIESGESKHELQITQVWLSQSVARPGDTVELTCVMSGEDGLEVERTARYQVPIGAPLGRLYFTVNDATLMNFGDFAGLTPTSVRTPDRLIDLLNTLRPNDKAFVRVWRQEPSFSLPAGSLTDPPPSVALVLAHGSASVGEASLFGAHGSGVAEFTLSPGDYAVTGSKTVQLDIKE